MPRTHASINFFNFRSVDIVEVFNFRGGKKERVKNTFIEREIVGVWERVWGCQNKMKGMKDNNK